MAHNLARNAYGIYLVHYFFVIWLQYLLLGVAVFAAVKGAIVSAVSLLLSWGIAIAYGRVTLAARGMFAAPGSPAAVTLQRAASPAKDPSHHA